MDPDRLEFHLENWSRYMRSPGLMIWYKNKASGTVGGGYSQTFDELCDGADLACAEAVNAIINGDLTPAESCAVHHEYLEAAYRFPREPIDVVLPRARQKIADGLERKGIW